MSEVKNLKIQLSLKVVNKLPHTYAEQKLNIIYHMKIPWFTLELSFITTAQHIIHLSTWSRKSDKILSCFWAFVGSQRRSTDILLFVWGFVLFMLIFRIHHLASASFKVQLGILSDSSTLLEYLGAVLGFMADSIRNRNGTNPLRQLEGYICISGKGNTLQKSEWRQGPRLS